MAECHPVGFQWVMEAKARGATVIHVDPRFSRTSAMADLFVPIRAGTDIAFLGGIVRHVLESDAWFREYVLAYTNASTIIDERYLDTEDLDGLFSGFDAEHRTYEPGSWHYRGVDVAAASGERDVGFEQRAEEGRSLTQSGHPETHGSGGPALGAVEPQRDETLQHPRCVFQILRRHYARYTPEMVERVCGVP